MTVLLHPRKDAPERYRVWDRETRTQKYFPLTKAGKQEAEEFDRSISEIKKARSLSRDLPLNKLFSADGSVKGMRRVRRKKDGKTSEFLKLYANLKTTELSIGRRDFEATYSAACQWILQKHDIEETREIRTAFKKAKKLYWTSPKDTEESMPFWKKMFM